MQASVQPVRFIRLKKKKPAEAGFFSVSHPVPEDQ